MQNALSTSIIALNVDGVLTNARTYFAQRKGSGAAGAIDPVALAMLEKFCQITGAEVIMATSWTEMFYPTVDAWKALFKSKECDIPVIDVLRRPEGSADWIDVTRDYMETHGISNYALLVDDPTQPGQSRVIKTDARYGLTVAELSAAASMLAPNSKLVEELERFTRF
jgi:hypothetical protein